MTTADDPKVLMHRCVDHVFWDLIDIHDIPKGRKNDLTPITALIIYLSVIMRLRMRDIAGIFDVSRSTVTDYVDYLEKKGYVRRVRGDEDKRDIFIEPTSRGREYVRDKEIKTLDYANAGIERLTPEERQVFLRLFMKFVGDFEKTPYENMLNKIEKE